MTDAVFCGNEADLAAVLALEQELNSSAVRNNPVRLQELLDTKFCEIGQSGRVYDREQAIAALIVETMEIEMSDVAARMLSESACLLCYTAGRGQARSRRSSVWVCDGHIWRIVFHQGTSFTGT